MTDPGWLAYHGEGLFLGLWLGCPLWLAVGWALHQWHTRHREKEHAWRLWWAGYMACHNKAPHLAPRRTNGPATSTLASPTALRWHELGVWPAVQQARATARETEGRQWVE